MTDKELIKKEIEKEMSLLDRTNAYDIGRLDELSHLLLFINSLPEEPASEDLIEEIDKTWKTCNPIDEGMGVETANIHIEQFDAIAHHFAEWQKQQMMKDAQLGIIEERADGLLGWDTVYGTDVDYRNYLLSHFKNGDKVKLIIIKEK